MISSSPRARAEVAQGGALGFDSLFGLLAWGAALVLLLLLPWQWAGFWPSDYNFWPQALFLLLLAGTAILLAMARLPAPRWDAAALLLSLFLGWNLVATLTASYAHDAWLELARVTGAVAFFWIARAFSTRAQQLMLVAAAVGGVAWLGGSALWNFVGTRDPRQFGPFLNPNLFANALALALPLALVLPLGAWSLTRNRVWAALGALPFLVLLPALAVTSSKGGFVAALVGLLATTVAVRAARRAAFGRALRRALPAIVVLGLVFGALAAKTIVPRLMATRGADDNSTMFRVYLWRGTLKMIEARPILGFGPGAFSGSYPRYATAGPSKSAHQSWLQIAAEGGVPALLLLAGALVVALRNAWRMRRGPDWFLGAGALGAVAAMLVHGCFDAGWGATPVAVLLMIALGIVQPPPAELTAAAAAEPRGNLSLGWIGATLLLGLAGYGTQQVALAEDTMAQSAAMTQRGAPAMALELARQAAALDPGSARAQGAVAAAQTRAREDGAPAAQRAIALQSDRAANYFDRAKIAMAQNRPDEADFYLSQALERDPLSSVLLLSRARFRLEHKDGRGYDDLERLMQLWDAPYGRYQALGDMVNFDFARGVALLAPRLQQTGQNARARKLIEHALRDVAAARAAAPQVRALVNAVGGSGGLDTYDDVDVVAARLQSELSQNVSKN